MFANVEPMLDAAEEKFKAINAKYIAGDPQLVGLRDEVLEVAEVSGILTRPVKQVAEVGFHPKNRGDNGVTPQEVPIKTSLLCDKGFSLPECERALLAGRAPGKVGDSYEQANINLAEASGGCLAPVAKGSLDSFTLTCNHTFQSFRSVHFGTANDDPSISTNGKVAIALVKSRCPPLAAVVEGGMRVRMLPWQFEQRWPSLVALLIEADNVPFAVAKSDTTWDLLQKIHSLSRQHTTPNGETDWAVVERMAQRSEIRRPEDIPELVAWVRSSSGGSKDPFVLSDVVRFVKGLKTPQEVPASVLGKFEKIYLGPSGLPHWRGGLRSRPLHKRGRLATL